MYFNSEHFGRFKLPTSYSVSLVQPPQDTVVLYDHKTAKAGLCDIKTKTGPVRVCRGIVWLLIGISVLNKCVWIYQTHSRYTRNISEKYFDILKLNVAVKCSSTTNLWSAILSCILPLYSMHIQPAFDPFIWSSCAQMMFTVCIIKLISNPDRKETSPKPGSIWPASNLHREESGS